jgi:dephospho-CoA kinase
VVHQLLAGDELRKLLVERYGDEIAPNGQVDRSKLADVVFADREQRAWLEGELWPRVGARIAAWREEAQRSRPIALVVEVPLLFESGMEAAFDRTVAIVADESVRHERAAARGHASLEARGARQLTQDQKAQRADFVVRNDGTIEDLERNLSEILATIGG